MIEGTIFICDDEEGIRRYLKKMLQLQGFPVETFADGPSLLNRLQTCESGTLDLLLLDIRMPDMDGLEVLSRVSGLRPSLPVVIMTAHGTIESAVEAIKCGAYDYITKPFPREKVIAILEKALERELLRKENQELKEELSKQSAPGEIIFASSKFREVYEFTINVARSEANILIQGETGTGKELIARAVHYNSSRRDRRFLSINCAALTETLLESTLFGHVRGAFTGAVTSQKGLLEEAHGGTLFMDEIGDISLSLQAKLLRVVQEREFIPVGDVKAKKADIRFVAATNKDLAMEVRQIRFREDLFYRLNVIGITLPPLRERRDDIRPLAWHFVDKYSRRMHQEMADITPEALQMLLNYSWPGNVRELENVIERAVILSRGKNITPDLLPLRKTPATPPPALFGAVSLEAVEKEHIRNILTKTGFHKSRTAGILGISRKTLDRKLAEYEIRMPRDATDADAS